MIVIHGQYYYPLFGKKHAPSLTQISYLRNGRSKYHEIFKKVYSAYFKKVYSLKSTYNKGFR